MDMEAECPCLNFMTCKKDMRQEGRDHEYASIGNTAADFKKIYRGRPGSPVFPIGHMKVDMEEPYDFGYSLRKEFWSQGIATEAAKAVIEQVKQDGIPYITATHDRNNPRSGGVMKKVGMKYQYSYEEQWQPKNIPVTFRLYQLNLDGDTERVCRKYWDMYPVHFVESV